MYNENPSICVVGSSNMDLLSKVPRLPKLGETLIGHHFYIGFGGKGANQAVMAARLKAQVTMVTKLGNDIFGKETIKNYENNNINTKYVYFCDESSGVAPIFVDDEGNNFIVIVPGANWKLSPDEVAASSEVIEKSDSIVCQLEIPLESSFEAFKIAKIHNVITIFNPAPARLLPDDFYRIVDIIIPNEVEASLLSGIEIKTIDDAKSAAEFFLKKGAKYSIITLGKSGSLIFDGNTYTHIKPLSVKAIDSTGAGDAFIGAFSYYYSLSKNILKSAEFASVAAGLSVTKIGTQTSFPFLEDILKEYNI